MPADVGVARVRIVKPVGVSGTLPAVLYMHGGGWVLGSAATHDRLARELAVGVDAAVVFVEYDRSPEARARSQSSRATRRTDRGQASRPRGANAGQPTEWTLGVLARCGALLVDRRTADGILRPRTAEWQLREVCTKLGGTSHRQLRAGRG